MLVNGAETVNESMELSECRDKWTFDEKYNVWCLEDIIYTPNPVCALFQRMSIFVPKEYMNAEGEIVPDGKNGKYTAKTAPVVFENNSAGYAQMPHTWLGGPRCEAERYLRHGMVYVTCGSRGRDSISDIDGAFCGKSPMTLVDLKTGIRFLRHNAGALPGDFSKIVSVGWSAGGAMSALLGVTGDHEDYTEFLRENGAFMDESDTVFAAQVYCPIIDLEHADMTYEWQFMNDKHSEAGPTGPEAVMTGFQEALSQKLYSSYIEYFNAMGLKHPVSGETLFIGEDGRSGSGYEYLMERLAASASDFLHRIEEGSMGVKYSVSDYLSGNYTELVRPPFGGPRPPMPQKEDEKARPHSLGMNMLRPPKGAPAMPPFVHRMIEAQGSDKRVWLTWDGKKAFISSFEDYTAYYRPRMKPCTSFDVLGMNSPENQEFGSRDTDYTHFSAVTAAAVESLKDEFPAEYAALGEAFKNVSADEELKKRISLINPYNYIRVDGSGIAEHFRVHVGAKDADTSFMISLVFALKLMNAGFDTIYNIIWDRPHCEADYGDEVCTWIEKLV